ncbi:MAG: hypothetical protein R3E97_09725 [Candidatus Eisenbacteria bacterium]
MELARHVVSQIIGAELAQGQVELSKRGTDSADVATVGSVLRAGQG